MAAMSDDEKAAEALIWENVRLGYMELVGVGEDGQMRYRLTEAGQQRIDRVQRGDDEPLR
jgi:hypothetical protein